MPVINRNMHADLITGSAFLFSLAQCITCRLLNVFSKRELNLEGRPVLHLQLFNR